MEIASFDVDHFRWPSELPAECHKIGVRRYDRVVVLARQSPNLFIGSLFETNVPNVDQSRKRRSEPLDQARRKILVE